MAQDWIGWHTRLDWMAQDWIGLHKIGLDGTRSDWMAQDWIGWHKIGLDGTRSDWMAQDRISQVVRSLGNMYNEDFIMSIEQVKWA